MSPTFKTMEAKEKAKNMIVKYLSYTSECYNNEEAKQCALIAVQEIINANPHSNPFNTNVYSTMEYWLEVKNEIEKL